MEFISIVKETVKLITFKQYHSHHGSNYLLLKFLMEWIRSEVPYLCLKFTEAIGRAEPNTMRNIIYLLLIASPAWIVTFQLKSCIYIILLQPPDN